jgi:cell division protein FtsZ
MHTPPEQSTGLHFDLPKNRSSVIKVIGVGGGGSNAVNYMKLAGINGVDFVVCNTDAQALEHSPVETKIQLGQSLTEGMGAGANPEIGERAALESVDEIKALLSTNTKMVFITAGMGGGTGTGAAPVLAKAAQEMGILTVGIVTLPFAFEGNVRARQAEAGIEKLRSVVDSLIVVNNNKLREMYGNLGFKAGFNKADQVLATAARGIAEVITHHYRTNIDLRDAKTVLAGSGTALMGSFQASGVNRATDAIAGALDSPLLNDNRIQGAKNVLLLIVSGSNEHEITFDEIGEINDFIQNEAGGKANIIMGIGEDSTLGQAVQVTVIATGFEANTIRSGMSPKEEAKVVHNLDADAERALRLAAFDAPLNTERTSVESFANASPVAAAVATAPWEMEMAPATDVVAEDAPLAFASAERAIEFAPEEDASPAAALTEVANVETPNFSAPLEERSPANTATFQMDAAPSLFDFDDFVIRDVAPATDFEEPTHEVEFVSPFDLGAQEAIDLKHSGAAVMEWDLPLSASPFGAANDVTAEDATENIPVAEAPEASDGIKRHTLDELLALEEALGMRKSAPEATPEPPVPAHLRFEVKTVTTPPQSVEDYAGPASAPDPLEQRVEMAMQQMAADRRRNLRSFNHTFKSVQRNGAEEFAQVPAFQRAGVAVDHSLISQQQPLSSTSLNGDGDDLTFRTHNRFLHDNVD